MKYIALVLCCALLATTAIGAAKKKPPAQGAEAATFLYSRDRVFIEVDAPIADSSATNAATEEPKPDQPASEIRSYYYDTEIRPEESLAVDWFYSLDSMSEGHAAMIFFKKPHALDLPEAKILHAIDVLVIGNEGKILAILPNIVPAAQEKKINLDMPVKALMYLPGGDAEKLNIQPKDMVKNKLFAPNPVVLQ